MKKLLFVIILLLISNSAFSKNYDLKFNVDAFQCGSSFTTLYKTEMESKLYHVSSGDLNLTGLSLEEKIDELAASLKVLNNSRAKFLLELVDRNNSRIQFKSGIQIIRSSPAANLILPGNCNVQVLADVTLTKTDYFITINQEIFSQLTIDDQANFWFNLGLDLEQAIFKYVRANYVSYEVEFNQLQGREFLACWFSSNCRPKTYSEFHQLALKKEYSLQNLEQAGIIVPVEDNYFVFNKSSGLIERTRKIADTQYFAQTKAFDSYYSFKNKNYHLSSAAYSDHNSIGFVQFNEAGKVICVTVDSYKFPDAEGIQADFFGKKVHFESPPPIWIISPLCWNDDETLKQVRIPLDHTEELFVPINGTMVNLAHFDLNNDREKYGITFSFYEDNIVNWIQTTRGYLSFLSQNIKINGAVKLFPTGEIQCLTPYYGTELSSADGQKLIGDGSLFCFNKEGIFEKKYDIGEGRKLMSKDFLFAW